MNADTMTDDELIEALELAAPRIRLAGADDFRQIADVIATLALEATRRLRGLLEVLEEKGNPPAAAAGPLLGTIRNVTLHTDGRLTAYLEVNGAGSEFLRQVKGARS